jgi:hypothetical protein
MKRSIRILYMIMSRHKQWLIWLTISYTNLYYHFQHQVMINTNLQGNSISHKSHLRLTQLQLVVKTSCK